MMPLLPATFAVALALAATPAKQVGKLALVDLDTPPTMIGMGSQVAKALAAAAAREKLQVVTGEDLRTALGAKRYEDLVKCAGKGPCVSAALSGQKDITRAISGSLALDEKNYLLKLALIDVATANVIADVDRSILIASRRFQKDVEQLSGPLLRGEQEARGTLVVQANVKNAQVTVNGEFIGVAPVKLQLKPGKHEVKVERPKYLPVVRLVDVDPKKTTTTDVRLILKPGETRDEDEVPALVAKTEPVTTQGFRITPPTIVAGGAALVAFGVGTVFGIQSSSAEKRLLSGYDKVNDTYAGTRADALSARSNATIANISFGVAAAAVVVTGVLVFFDIRAADTPVEVTPVAGPDGAGVFVGGHF